MNIDYSRNNGPDTLTVSQNSPMFDVLDYYDESPLHSRVLDKLDTFAGLRSHVEEYVERTIRQARAEGHSWQAVADVLGVSKQAAQQRYGD